MKNKTVFDNNIFRLYIPFRKYLTLESILKEENIKFYIDFETPNSVTDFVRFYFEKKDELSYKDLNYIFFYLKEVNEDEVFKNILIPLISKRFSRGEIFFENIRQLINSLEIQNDTKVFLLVTIFIYSRDGMYRQFVNKEALKDAIAIDENETLNVLTQCLFKIFSNFSFQIFHSFIYIFHYAKHNTILNRWRQLFHNFTGRTQNH